MPEGGDDGGAVAGAEGGEEPAVGVEDGVEGAGGPAFIYIQPGANPAVDRTVVDGEHDRLFFVGVPDPSAAPDVAARLVDTDGIQQIELYGGVGAADAARESPPSTPGPPSDSGPTCDHAHRYSRRAVLMRRRAAAVMMARRGGSGLYAEGCE